MACLKTIKNNNTDQPTTESISLATSRRNSSQDGRRLDEGNKQLLFRTQGRHAQEPWENETLELELGHGLVATVLNKAPPRPGSSSAMAAAALTNTPKHPGSSSSPVEAVAREGARSPAQARW